MLFQSSISMIAALGLTPIEVLLTFPFCITTSVGIVMILNFHSSATKVFCILKK